MLITGLLGFPLRETGVICLCYGAVLCLPDRVGVGLGGHSEPWPG